MRKIIILAICVLFVFSFTGFVFAGSQGSGMEWYGSPEMTQGWAYMSDPGYTVNVSVELFYLGNRIAQANDMDFDYARAETSYEQYNHEDCSVQAVFDAF